MEDNKKKSTVPPQEPEKPKLRSMLESDFSKRNLPPKEPEKPKAKIDLEEYSISIAKIRKALEE
ncbi:hypothetical protein AAX29_01732 [Aliarcobacter thereius]|uniref:Uncharacterized protein n=1 Tax=Aliarcobacter thereius TaxID=544718 RepID=A0A1C0B5M4_9BACT|nr:hypothetical protein [Aliarcobacter thereius]OCL98213.1 hypothetical protein AAX29_01732 [Aliarcobacter thereius]